MTAHNHIELTPGCYRCEINVDEMQGALESVTKDLQDTRQKLFELGDDVSDEAMLAGRELINEIAELHTERFELIIGLANAKHRIGIS